MTSSNAVHALILTLNEEAHIGRCLRSIRDQVASVTVIDSGSTDRTRAIARDLGAEVLDNPWINYATQFNFGLASLAGREGWILRIDADEVYDTESGSSIRETVAQAGDDIDGFLVLRRIYFMGRRIRYGSIEPSWQLRLWRNGSGTCEERWMDEHIRINGKRAKSTLIISDINLNSVDWWTDKHNRYASREAIDQITRVFQLADTTCGTGSGLGNQARLRRYVKEKLYYNSPPGLRPLAYFVYRYIIRAGFVDGREGLYFHLLQGLWYRVLVDAKIADIVSYSKRENVSLKDAIFARTGTRIVDGRG